MKSKVNPELESRRGFFKKSATALGGAAIAVATGMRSARATPSMKRLADPSAPKGYHVTPHILEYYRKAQM